MSFSDLTNDEKREYYREYYQKNKDKINENCKRRYREKTKDSFRKKRIFERMYIKCNICKKEFPTEVKHYTKGFCGPCFTIHKKEMLKDRKDMLKELKDFIYRVSKRNYYVSFYELDDILEMWLFFCIYMGKRDTIYDNYKPSIQLENMWKDLIYINNKYENE